MVRIFLAFIFLLSASLAASVQSGEGIPDYNIDTHCSESKYEGFSDPKALAQGCRSNEANYRDQVEELWAGSAEEARRECAARVDAYQYLYNCLAREQPVKRPTNDDPCDAKIYKTRISEKERDDAHKEIRRLGEMSCDNIQVQLPLYERSAELGDQIVDLYEQLKKVCPALMPSLNLNSDMTAVTVLVDKRQVKRLKSFQEQFCAQKIGD